jgi:hypothetical protein
MGSFIGPSFAFDLSAACGHGCPDCPSCCGISACGCSGIPQTLHASLKLSAGSVGTCACGLPLTVTLTYDAGTQRWSGTTAFGSCGFSVTIVIYCVSGVWKLDYSFSNGCASATGISAFTASCSPFDLKWVGLGIQNCCAPGPPALMDVEVTV